MKTSFKQDVYCALQRAESRLTPWQTVPEITTLILVEMEIVLKQTSVLSGLVALHAENKLEHGKFWLPPDAPDDCYKRWHGPEREQGLEILRMVHPEVKPVIKYRLPEKPVWPTK
ncbi:MAG: hypothetical protein AAF413_04040 [Patescibacteria group bacterium]